MKVVNYIEFIKLPINTLYSDFTEDSCIINNIYCKQETISDNDWFYTNFTGTIEYDDDVYESFSKLKNSLSVELDTTSIERDGMFDRNRKFIVYEKQDIINLMKVLKKALNE